MKLTIKEFAKKENISVQAVYKKIKQGKLKTVKENGKTYVIWEKEKYTDKNNGQKENLKLLLENERLKAELQAEKEKIKLIGESYKKIIEAKENEINTLKGAFVELRNTYNQKIKELENKLKELPDTSIKKNKNRGIKNFLKWFIPD